MRRLRRGRYEGHGCGSRARRRVVPGADEATPTVTKYLGGANPLVLGGGAAPIAKAMNDSGQIFASNALG